MNTNEETPVQEMDKLTDRERELLRNLLKKGERPEGEIGIGFGSVKTYVKGINLITFMFMLYMAISLGIFWQFKKDTAEQHRILSEQNEEQSFIATLTSEQRAQLGIQMPESLARKLTKQQQYEDHNSRRMK